MSDAIQRARQIAKNVLAGEYDPLLACREIVDLKDYLPDGMTAELWGVDSEIDGWPLGAERAYWDTEALKEKDLIAAKYRDEVRTLIEEDLRVLLEATEDDR